MVLTRWKGLTAFILAVFFAFAATVAAAEPAAKAAKTAAKADKPAATAAPAAAKPVVSKKKTGFLSKLDIKLTPYGHLRLDGAWDENRTNSGNTAMWSGKPGEGPEANLTCNHTRVGVTAVGPKTLGVTPGGKLEIDFYGGNSEILQNVRLRHAYLEFALGSGFFLLAGQTFDVHGTLFAKTLNTAIAWNGGNLCFRRPQLRLGWKGELEGGWFLAQAALARAVGGIKGGDLDGNGHDDGEDAAVFDVQGAVELAFPAWVDEKPVILSVGGHYGVERLEGIGYIPTWSVVANLTLPLAKCLALEGEVWAGENLDAYRGGVGQGIDVGRAEGVPSKGGFVQLLAGPFWRFRVHAGFGTDDPENRSLVAGKRSLNRTWFVNVRFTMAKACWIGLEYQGFRTDYLRGERGECNRVQATFYFKL